MTLLVRNMLTKMTNYSLEGSLRNEFIKIFRQRHGPSFYFEIHSLVGLLNRFRRSQALTG